MGSGCFVDLLVPGKVRAPGVTLSALHALVGLLARVSSQVPDKMGVTAEAFPTHGAVMVPCQQWVER